MNLFGHSADKRRERRWHLIVPALMGAIGFAVAASYSHNTAVSIVFLSLAAGGVLTCAPLFWSLPTAFLARGRGRDRDHQLGRQPRRVRGPYVIGYLKDVTHSTASGMYVLAAMLVIGAIAVWLTPAKLVNR